MVLSRHLTWLLFILSSILLVEATKGSTTTVRPPPLPGANLDISGLEEDIDDPIDTTVHDRQELLATRPLCAIGVDCRKKREANNLKRASVTSQGVKRESFKGDRLAVYKKATERLYKVLDSKTSEDKSRKLLHKVVAYAKRHPNPKYKKIVKKIVQDIKNKVQDEKSAMRDLKSLKNVLKNLKKNVKLPPLVADHQIKDRNNVTIPPIQHNVSKSAGNSGNPPVYINPPKAGNLAVTAKTISGLLSAIANILDSSSARIKENQRAVQSEGGIGRQPVPMTGMQYPFPINSRSGNYQPQMLMPRAQPQFPMSQSNGIYPPPYPVNGMQYTLPINPQSVNYPATYIPETGMQYSLPDIPQPRNIGYQPEVSMPQMQPLLSNAANVRTLKRLQHSMHKGSLPTRSVHGRLHRIISLMKSHNINSGLRMLAMETYNLKNVTPNSLKLKIYLIIRKILDYKLSKAEVMLRNLPTGKHSKVTGKHSKVTGKHSKVTGKHSKVTGKHSKVDKTALNDSYVPNPGFSEWGQWSSCNAECGVGTQSRRRFCYVAKKCAGSKSVERRPCETKECP